MRILYIYPHPDDESFGTAHAMSKQRRQGHDVYLLTLTKGGATRQRFKYGYSVDQMGEVRHREMLDVAKVLDLTRMTVLDFPDGGLKEADPRQLEAAIGAEVRKIEPDVLVTYAVHGISGFDDHLVAHAIVKRAYVELQERLPRLRRLALLTITEQQAKEGVHFPLRGSKSEDIDCIFEVDETDIAKCRSALDCYVTFQETIEKTRIKEQIRNQVVFEIFQEDHAPPLQDLFEGFKS